MSRICQVCGKRPHSGNRVARRGKAKHLGGVGRKITGVTKRWFAPNLQRVRTIQEGTVKRMRVCTQCLRSGKIVKPPRRPRPGEEGPVALAPPQDAPVSEPVVADGEGVLFQAVVAEDKEVQTDATE